MQKRTFRPHFRSSGGGGRGRGAGMPSGSAASRMVRYVKKVDTIAPVIIEPSTLTFAQLPIAPEVLKAITNRGFTQPTPIQEKAIPYVAEGRDVIGIANTGTGKTAAFLIPLVGKMLKNRSEKIIIMMPTRELGIQIQDELKQLAVNLQIFSALCIGGSSIHTQMHQLRRNPNVIIGTPGRLKDLIKRNAINMKYFTTVVLDEVDRMVDMGFINDIRYLLSLLPEARQSLFFSATVPASVGMLLQSFSKNPITVSVRSQDTAVNVDQDIVKVENGKTKIEVLETLLEKNAFRKVLIFGRTKWGVEKLSIHLDKKGFKVASIHGDKPQRKREMAIRLFKDETVNILVATDVAARGIDIVDITHVINYDEPATYEDYIHRIGRTGRANKKGFALTFLD